MNKNFKNVNRMTFNIVHSVYFFVLLQCMVESMYILIARTAGKWWIKPLNYKTGRYFSVIN